MFLRRRVRLALPLAMAIALSACGDDPPAPEEHFITSSCDAGDSEPLMVSEVDVLWVIDNSNGMCEEQTSLRDSLDAFMVPLLDADIDCRMAVITTDMDNPMQSGRFQNIPDPASCPQADLSMCPSPDNGGVYSPLVIRTDDPQYLKEDGTLDRDKLLLHLGCNMAAGAGGSDFTMGLEAVRTALSPGALETYNTGFLRPDADLAVVFVTDENDCSDLGSLDRGDDRVCEWDRNQLVPVREYIDFLTDLKGGDPERIIAAGIVAPDSGLRYETGQDLAPSCITDSGQGFSGYRYRELIDFFLADDTTDAWCRGTDANEVCALSNVCELPFEGALGAVSKHITEGARQHPVRQACQ